MRHSVETQHKALTLFLQGKATDEISGELGVKVQTIYRWVHDGNWYDKLRRAVEVSTSIVAQSRAEQLVDASMRQLEAYTLVERLATEQLQNAERPKDERVSEKDATFKSNLGATQALDMAIRGQRDIQKGLIEQLLLDNLYLVIEKHIDLEKMEAIKRDVRVMLAERRKR